MSLFATFDTAGLKVLKAIEGWGWNPGLKPRKDAPVWPMSGSKEWLEKIKGKIDQTPAPATLDESIAAYERNAAELERRLGSIDDAGWDRKSKFLMDGKVVWESTLGDMLWGFLFDAIHHRGQLSAYLRPMGGKVPSIYGPSADEGQM